MANPSHCLPGAFAGDATVETFPHPALANKQHETSPVVGVSHVVSNQTATALDKEALKIALEAKVPPVDHRG